MPKRCSFCDDAMAGIFQVSVDCNGRMAYAPGDSKAAKDERKRATDDAGGSYSIVTVQAEFLR